MSIRAVEEHPSPYPPLTAAEHVGNLAPRARRLGLRVAVGVVALIALPATVWAGVGQIAPARELPACVTEDQVTDCYWDASTRGNGRGTSFEVRDGVVTREDGTSYRIPAHELAGVTR